MITNNNTPVKKKLSHKTSYYKRFIDSGRINSSRFIPSVNTGVEADSGETAREALASAGEYTKKSVRHIRRAYAAYSKAYCPAVTKPASYSRIPDRPEMSSGAGGRIYSSVSNMQTDSRFQTGSTEKHAVRDSPVCVKSVPDSHSWQKKHIKKEYQKKAMTAAAKAAAPETAAVTTAVNAADRYISAGKRDGSGRIMMAAIIIMCIIPLIMPASIIYAAASLIAPVSEYLDAAAEDYRSGLSGDGTSEIITDAAHSPVTAEALNDPEFAALITEAEKYLGYPYVWGGSSPETSFDCSGFVSYIYRESGYYNMNRMTAQGIFNICTPVTYEDVRPGDLVFFTNTYNSRNPVTHIGIYAGGGYMIHAGDPIQYTSINTDYWTSHFYAYGRLTD